MHILCNGKIAIFDPPSPYTYVTKDNARDDPPLVLRNS